MSSPADLSPEDRDLLDLLASLPPDQVEEVVATLPPASVEAVMRVLGTTVAPTVPDDLLAQATLLDEGFTERAHLRYLADRLRVALDNVEQGRNQHLVIEMPPRTGKTTLATMMFPAWVMAQHPSWPVALTSHDGGLATSWGRTVRRWVEEGRLGQHLELRRDAGAASSWETTQGGKLLSISLRESFTGRGARVLVVDDPHKDFVDAHSATMRQNVWDWWLSVALTRLEPPYLVVVVMTRWHQDDLVGRLLSDEHAGDPADWEVIRFPALAESNDVLGRAPGEPLYTPLLTETADAALARWADARRSVGSYVWSAMYQQRPSPARGAIFDSGWWRYWTEDPSRVTEDGTTVLLPDLSRARFLDSWDMAFKGTADSDYVVGQRWARSGPDRFLLAQKRGRWSFTQTLPEVKSWSPGGPFASRVHQRLVEEKANGAAILDTLASSISGFKPINPRDSKEARARSVTPEIESGHVYLPHPAEPGHAWVTDLIAETREFPVGANDDQVDAMTQALLELRSSGPGSVAVPGARTASRTVGAAARSDTRRKYSSRR